MKRFAALPILAVLLFWNAASAQDAELSNNQVLLRIDSQGRVAELTNRETGHRYVSNALKAPWRMFYRAGDAIDLEIEPDRQKPRVSKQTGGLLIEYDQLIGQHARRGETRTLNASLLLRANLEDDRIIWTAEIRNREPGVELTEIWLPWLYGIEHLGLGQEADVLYWPEAAGRRIQNPRAALYAQAGARTGGEGPSLRMTYPWPASMQWFTLNNGEEGLYVGGHDKTLMTSALNVMAHQKEGLSASVVKYPFVKTGQSWTSEPVVTRVYEGDWHAAAGYYREWAQTWMERPDPPEWIRRAPGWAHPALGRKGQFGHITGRYSDYPKMLREARDLGLNTLIVFGWVKQGFDNRYPHYDPDETLGGETELRRALAEVKGAGGRTILYTQGQLIDPTTEFYKAKGHVIAAKDIWGYEYREQYAFGAAGTFLHMMRNKYFGVACPSAQGWQEQLISQYKLVNGHGAQGMIFDQMGGRPPYICFDERHDHKGPSLAAGPGKVANMRRLRELMKADDRDFAFVIELATDIYAGYADITHAWGPGFFPAPDSFGELFRYTFPDAVVTNRVGGTAGRKAQYGHAFTLGWRFDANTSDGGNAEVGPYLARLCQLRNKHSELLLEGRFVDNEGFVSDNSRVAAHGFVAGNRLAVALWNPTDTPQMTKVAAPGYKLEAAAWQDPKLTGPNHTLMPDDVAVLIFAR